MAGTLLDGSVLYGECKWSRAGIGEGVLDMLIERSGKAACGRGEARRRYALFARPGFKAGVRERAEEDDSIMLYSPDLVLAEL